MNTIKLYNYLIECAPDLMGVRYWAQYYSQRHGFDVFTYLGKDQNSDLHFFTERRSGSVYMRRLDELGKHGFKPFLYNFAKIDAVLKGDT